MAEIMSTTMTDIVWQPSGKYLNSRVADFMKVHGMKDWQELVARSQKDIEWFWSTFCQYAGIKWTRNYSHLLDRSGGIAWTKWFVDGKTNIAYNCLDWHVLDGHHHAGSRENVGKDHKALLWENEAGDRRELTYGELNELSGKIAALLKQLGLKPGDPVGIYMPMVPEVVAVMFGCLKFGSPFMPVFSGYGAKPLQVRMADAGVKVLFTADGGGRRGKLIDIKKDVDEAAEELPSLQHVIVVKYKGNAVKWHKRDKWFHDVVPQLEPFATRTDLDSEHPSMYLYTSGTTGHPKGCVHTHGGALATIAKELGMNFDVHPDDVFFWLTDIGWMMGPWMMIGVTFWGGTMVIYEGAPNYPSPDRIWKLVEDLKINTLGVSPTAIRVLKAAGDQWVDNHNFESLRLMGSTGEPWDHDSYMWFFEKVGGKRAPIINISGGTELVGCLLMPLPVMPIKACSLGAPGLGIDVDVFSEDGKPLKNEIGHLVCKQPAPSMTRGFLGEPERYLNTYFARFPDVWYHGDWAKVDDDGNWFLFGRSDDTIKVAGKRVGPGEVESVLIQQEAVAEAAVIGIPHEIKGEALVCFLVLMPGQNATPQLELEIKEHVGKELGHVLKPDKIHFVSALPKTRSGKIVRGAIKRQYLHEPLGDLSAIENPEALSAITSA
jgi:acetyl-CoA synthetase